jgi:hypothetical protein
MAKVFLIDEDEPHTYDTELFKQIPNALSTYLSSEGPKNFQNLLKNYDIDAQPSSQGKKSPNHHSTKNHSGQTVGHNKNPASANRKRKDSNSLGGEVWDSSMPRPNYVDKVKKDLYLMAGIDLCDDMIFNLKTLYQIKDSNKNDLFHTIEWLVDRSANPHSKLKHMIFVGSQTLRDPKEFTLKFLLRNLIINKDEKRIRKKSIEKLEMRYEKIQEMKARDVKEGDSPMLAKIGGALQFLSFGMLGDQGLKDKVIEKYNRTKTADQLTQLSLFGNALPAKEEVKTSPGRTIQDRPTSNPGT